MPRAAMSVATRARHLPALKAARARSRWPWDLSPWMAAAVTPTASRCLATRSAPRLVRVNTMVRVSLESANRSASRARLRAVSTNRICCLTRSTVVAAGATETFSGSFRSSPASLPISVGMVAEKNRFCRSLGRLETIRRIGCRKPRSSIWSASSSTNTSVWSSLATFSFRWSISRPGVATRMSTPAARALICGPYLAPPKITATVMPRPAP